MPSQKLFTTVRPPRIAVFINAAADNWQAQCLHILDHFSRTWGGSASIIIPTDGHTISPLFWKLLETFDPDMLLLYCASGAGQEIENPERFEQTALRRREEWQKQSDPTQDSEDREYLLRFFRDDLRHAREPFGVSPGLQNELKLRLAPFYFEEFVVEPGSCSANHDPGYPLCKVVDLISNLKVPVPPVSIPYCCSTFPKREDYDDTLWLGSIFGYCYPSTLDGLKTAGLQISITPDQGSSYGNRAVAFAELFDRHRRPAISIKDVSSVGLSFHRPLALHYWEQPTVVIAGETIQDFCFYYALSSVRERVLWIPPQVFRTIAHHSADGTRKDGDTDTMLFLSSVHTHTAYSSQYGRDVSLSSMSMGLEELKKFSDSCSAANGIGRLAWATELPSNLVPTHPLRLYEINNAYFPSTVQLSDDSQIQWFEQRPPKFLAKAQPGKMRWITELTFDGVAVPRHFSLGYWMMGSPQNTTKNMRVSSEGLAFESESLMILGGQDSETASTRPTIRIPTPMDVFTTIARSSSLSCEKSDKGLYTSVAIQKFGGLAQTAAFFKSHTGKRLFHALLSKEKEEIGIFLSDERRRYLDFDAINSLAGDTRAAADICDRFVRTGILKRGFIFLCEYCRRSAWYALAEVTEEFTCRRCRRSQIFLKRHWKKPEQPNIYYQLDEMIFQGLQHDMDIPILTLDLLRRTSAKAFGFVEELRFWANDVGNVAGEFDIGCISDSFLVIGEAKRGDRLANSAAQESKIIQKYVALQRELAAKRMVFATGDLRWRDETVRKVREAFPSHIELTFLGQSELEN